MDLWNHLTGEVNLPVMMKFKGDFQVETASSGSILVTVIVVAYLWEKTSVYWENI